MKISPILAAFFLLAFHFPLLLNAQDTGPDLRFDTIPVQGNSRFHQNFNKVLADVHRNAVNGCLPSYDSPLCEKTYTTGEIYKKVEIRRKYAVLNDPADPYAGSEEVEFIDSFIFEHIDGICVSYLESNAGMRPQQPFSLTILYNDNYNAQYYKVTIPGFPTKALYTVKFADLKKFFSPGETGLVTSFIKNPVGSKVTFDTLTVSNNHEGAIFRNIFLGLDQRARSNQIKTYEEYPMGTPMSPAEVKEIGQVEIVWQVYLDEANPYAGTFDSIVGFTMTGEEVKHIVVAYECYDPQGRFYFTTQPVSLCAMMEYKRVRDLDTGIMDAEQNSECMYCLDYGEIKSVLTKKQLEVVEEYLRDSQDLCR